MQTQITARHFEAPPSLRDYAADRLSKLERYYDGITDAHIVLSSNGDASNGHGAEIILNVYRQTLSARDQAGTYEDAIDRCVERLKKQIIKYKDQLRSTQKNAHR